MSAPIRASSAAVNSFRAKAVGHMAPSSRFALSLKPKVAYLVLNFCALWKKQTTLPSLAYAGIPYQVLGERAGALALMMAWKPLGHGAIRFRHLGDLREDVAFPVRLARARAAAPGRLQLLGARPHRGSFLVRESRGRLAGGALGRLLRVLHGRFPYARSDATTLMLH